ncbi:MAG: sec-independent protein translocase protein [Candidatus Saccharibacteria bacterium]|nr:sec-independent protein translocase protein [Candidatus Saccharibacteria bacterium]
MQPSLFDSHCHVHEAHPDFTAPLMSREKWVKAGMTDPNQIIQESVDSGVDRMICVGTTLGDSRHAVDFVADREHVWASIGIHPHEADQHLREESWADFAALATSPKVVAVGECGLDYFYGHSTPENQAIVLRKQIELALEHDLAMIFHTREAFDDFWPIFDSYQGIRGVLHSFTDNQENMQKAVDRGLMLGVNGIATFAKDPAQLAMYKAIPLQNLLLETDAPYLTPNPYRGTICIPKHVRVTAEFLAQLRSDTVAELAAATSANANRLFGL